VFPGIAAISAQNVLAETLQMIVVGGMSPADAVAAGQARMAELSR
jgi:multiple sugar transport system substrate-binding protein